MTLLLDDITKLEKSDSIELLLNQIKDIKELNEQEAEQKIIKIINKVILITRLKKSERILIPINNEKNISITTATGLSESYSTYSGSPFISLYEIKIKIFGTNAIDEISKYLTPDGQKELIKIKDILNKYDIKHRDKYSYGSNTPTIKIIKPLKITPEEAKYVLPKITANKYQITIQYEYGKSSIKIGDGGYSDFEFTYSEKTDSRYIFSLAIAEKYEKEICDTILEYIDLYNKKFPIMLTCLKEMQEEFSKYTMLEMI